MILGTSKILSKSGPGDLRIITKMLQRIQEKYGIILENIMFVNMDLKQIRFFSKECMSRVPYVSLFGFRFVSSCLFRFVFDFHGNLHIYLKNSFCGDED